MEFYNPVILHVIIDDMKDFLWEVFDLPEENKYEIEIKALNWGDSLDLCDAICEDESLRDWYREANYYKKIFNRWGYLAPAG